MRSPLRFFLAATAAGAALGTSAQSVQAAEFGLAINTNLYWVDNVLQQPSGVDKTDDTAIQLNPVLTFTQDNDHVRTNLKYTAQSIFFNDQSDLDETFHQLDAASDWHVVSDFLDLRLRANMWQQLIDPGQQLNYQNLFSTRNLLDATSGSAEPAFDHEFGPVRVQAGYLYGVINYSGSSDLLTAQDDASNQTGRFGIGSSDGGGRFSWNADYHTEQVDYDVSSDYRYDRATGRLEVGLTPSFRLIGEGGGETDLSIASDEGGVDSSFWRGGFRWEPDRSNLIEATAGERFFGTAYSARIEHRAKFLDMRVRYFEEPTTEARRQLAQFADPSSGPVVTPPDVPNVPITSRLTADAYVHKQASARLKATGRRTTIDVRAWTEDRDYILGDIDEHGYGAELNIQRQLSARNQLQIYGWLERVSLVTDELSRDAVARIGLTRRFSPNLSASITVAHVREEGLNPYDATIGNLGLQWTLR
jgi:hypothetical protein